VLFRSAGRDSHRGLPPSPAPAGDSSTKVAPRAAPPTGLSALLREKGPFSVLLSPTQNPKALPMVMELVAADETTARNLMQKPNLAVAKGISREAAVQLASRFKAINVAVRITQAKA
jgi:hypothetical protein